jgi:hypothetical protein
MNRQPHRLPRTGKPALKTSTTNLVTQAESGISNFDLPALNSMRRTASPSRPYGRYAVGLRPSPDPDAYFDAPNQDKEVRRINQNDTAVGLDRPRSFRNELRFCGGTKGDSNPLPPHCRGETGCAGLCAGVHSVSIRARPRAVRVFMRPECSRRIESLRTPLGHANVSFRRRADSAFTLARPYGEEGTAQTVPNRVELVAVTDCLKDSRTHSGLGRRLRVA